MTRVLRVLLIVLALALAGCTQPADGQPAPDGTWHLDSFGTPSGLEPGHDQVRSSIRLANGNISGNAGVNDLFGTYRRTASGEIRFADLAANEMSGPPAAVAQEERFVQALRDTRRYDLTDDRLVLANEGNDTLLVLRRD